MPRNLKKSFFTRPDVLVIARELLGKYLFTRLDDRLTGGIIIETEAYRGTTDKASHAFGGKVTARNRIMYMRGGTAYVYLCYGMHHLFNIVTNKTGIPDAVLIRAIEPTYGIEVMLKRRKLDNKSPRLANGPGSMSAALGITTGLSGIELFGPEIWLEDRGNNPAPKQINASPRVGVDYAGAHAKLPWRFRIKEKYEL